MTSLLFNLTDTRPAGMQLGRREASHLGHEADPAACDQPAAAMVWLPVGCGRLLAPAWVNSLRK